MPNESRHQNPRLIYGLWGDYNFRCFLSYTHSDSAWADKIGKRLNDFILPRELNGVWTPFGPPPKNLKPFYRDRGVQGAHHSIDEAIVEKLDDSAALIVICSPQAAQSKHVANEISHFIRTGRRSRIFAIIVDGEPNDPATDPFPGPLRFSLGDNGEIDKSTQLEPIAADARRQADGWPYAFHKLVAGMLDVDADLVSRRDIQRERWEQRRQALNIFVAVNWVIASVALVVAALQLGNSRTSQARYLADQALIKAESILNHLPADVEDDASLLQRLLNELGYKPGPDDGAPGPASRAAIKRFQSDLGRETSGTLAPEETKLLLSQWRTSQMLLPKFLALNVLPGPGQLIGQRIDSQTFNTLNAVINAEGISAATRMRHEGWVRSAVFDQAGARIVTASFDGTAKIWDAANGDEIRTLAHGDWVRSAAFDQAGARIVTASSDRTAKIWDTVTGDEIRSFSGHEGSVYSATFDQAGARIVTASFDGTAKIWDAATGDEIRTLSGHEGSVRSAAFDQAGARIVTVSDDGTAKIWDAATGDKIWSFAHGGWVNSAAFDQAGARIVTASSDRTAKIWGAESGQVIAVLKGHGSSVFSAAFSPDGMRVVTASMDETALVWNILDQISKHQSEIELSNPRALRDVLCADENLREFTPDDSTLKRYYLERDRPHPCENFGLLSPSFYARLGR